MPAHSQRSRSGPKRSSSGGTLLFASEAKALFVHPGVKRQLNPRFLGQVFTFWTGLDTGSSARLAPCGSIPASVPSGLSVDGSPTDAGDCL